jgi:hypothetical protein
VVIASGYSKADLVTVEVRKFTANGNFNSRADREIVKNDLAARLIIQMLRTKKELQCGALFFSIVGAPIKLMVSNLNVECSSVLNSPLYEMV